MASQKLDAEHLSRITKQAAEIAALVPEHLQEAAFNRAFDQLSGSGSGQTVRRPSQSTSPRTQQEVESDQDPALVLINSLSRTNHPEVTKASLALDRALYVLRIADTNYGIDGMTAPQIARVLTDKFRQRVSRQAINQALDAAGGYVDRTPTKKGIVYRLMQPGEDYLDAGGATRGGSEQAASSESTRRTRRRRAPRKPPATIRTKPGKEKASASRGAKTRKRSGRGPKAAIEELIGDGFLNEPRSIAAIQEQLRHKKGVQFKPTDLSPALVRLLRQNKLDRERNESNQYEYTLPA